MSNIIEHYLETRRRRAARRELGNLNDHYLRDLGIERDQVEAAVAGLQRAAGVPTGSEPNRRMDWRKLFGVSRWTRYQTEHQHGV